jgi:hypothetical protein
LQQITRPSRNPRRAYDAEGRPIQAMSLGNMREHGVRSVLAICQEASCGHSMRCPVLRQPLGVLVTNAGSFDRSATSA